MPLISIIIPAYNRARILPRAIKSAQAQTISHWEMIIVDDGSTDETKKMIEKYTLEDARIRGLYNEKNKGISATRNKAMREATGEYIAFLDSDDEWLPEKLARQIEVFGKDERIGLVYTGLYIIDEEKKTCRAKEARIDGNIQTEQLAYNPIGGPSRVMIKRECIKTCGLFDETLQSLEDWDLWIRITEKYSVGCVQEPVVNYYESPDSISINKEKIIKGYEKLWEKYGIEKREPSVRAQHYLRLGHRLCYYNIGIGRDYIRKALRVDPFRIKHILIFLLSLLPLKLYRMITYQIMKKAA